MKGLIIAIALTGILTPRTVQALNEQDTKDLLFSNCMEIMTQLVKTDYQLKQTITQCRKDTENFYPYIERKEHTLQEAGDYWIEQVIDFTTQ